MSSCCLLVLVAVLTVIVPCVCQPFEWEISAYIKASNTGASDQFGTSVACDGDTLVVGAPEEDSGALGPNGDQLSNAATGAGAVYVFTRAGDTWSQQAYLKASNTGAGDKFGTSVAISGDTVVVGAPSEDSVATGVNGDQQNNTQLSAGAVYVFTRAGAAWSQQAYLKASNTRDFAYFGGSVSVSGDTVVVGAIGDYSAATGVNGDDQNLGAADSGAAYVFTRNGVTWSQQAYLKASNTRTYDNFGVSVAISGNTVVVGSIGESSSATGVNGDDTNEDSFRSGAAYVFNRGGATWSQQAYLKASNTDSSDGFGGTVTIYGDTVVVGAGSEDSLATGVNGDQQDNSGDGSGAAYVFTRTGVTWSQQAYLKPTNSEDYDFFGGSIAIFGASILVGTSYESSSATGINGDANNNLAAGSGAAYAYTTNEVAVKYVKASNTQAGDQFATSMALSSTYAVICATGEASASTGINGNQADNSSPESGACYIYATAPPPATSSTSSTSSSIASTSTSSSASSNTEIQSSTTTADFTGSSSTSASSQGTTATTTTDDGVSASGEGSTSAAATVLVVIVAIVAAGFLIGIAFVVVREVRKKD